MEVEGVMMGTVEHERIEEYFDGKVTIDELNSYNDSRGFVCELWREDDYETNFDPSITGSPELARGPLSPKMCYFSQTEPLVIRGPHEHEEQTDWFISIKSKMIYMFVNKNEDVEYFITDPEKIYRTWYNPFL